MPVFHQEFNAVLLGLDGVLRCDLNDFDGVDVEFKPAGSARIGADSAGDPAGTFDRLLLRCCNCRFGDIVAEDNALDNAAAVAEPDEDQFPLFGFVHNPSGEGDDLSVVMRNRADRGSGKE